MPSPSIHHLAFRTRDVARLVGFYRELFGLPVAREQPGYSVWLRLGEAVLMIEQRAEGEPEPSPASMELVAFGATPSEREALREALRARGVPVEAETAYSTYFRDPDGRRVAVSSYAFPTA